MTCLDHSLRNRGPAVDHKPFFFFCLCCTYTWDVMPLKSEVQIVGPKLCVPGSRPTSLSLK